MPEEPSAALAFGCKQDASISSLPSEDDGFAFNINGRLMLKAKPRENSKKPPFFLLDKISQNPHIFDKTLSFITFLSAFITFSALFCATFAHIPTFIIQHLRKTERYCLVKSPMAVLVNLIFSPLHILKIIVNNL